MIIPSIDLMGGKAVQLRQGRDKVLERDGVFELAREFSLYGDIAVIDLDAALNQGSNKDLVKRLCREFPCRVGGGIRSEELGREYLKAGARKIIIGTKAAPDFLKQFAPDNLIVAVDEKAGKVTTEGWRAQTADTVIDKAKQLEDYCSEFLYTQVDTEGMLRGIDIDKVDALAQATYRRVTAAGGITTVADVRNLARLGVNAQIGMAVYTGALKLPDIACGIVDFGKGLAPTVVRDEAGRVLMLAFSSQESLREALDTRRGVYFSRSRNELWRKGDTSGHVQTLLRVDCDCDGDTLLFTVKQDGRACHLNQHTCFGDAQRDITAELFDKLAQRKRDGGSSYSAKLFTDPSLLKEKIMEEARELVDARERDHLVWEAADLLFFTCAWMVKHDIAMQDVLTELRARQKW